MDYTSATPTNTALIVAFVKYVHGGDTPLPIPRTLDLYIRTLGRITVYFMLCPGYAINGQRNDGTEPVEKTIYITFEDVQGNNAYFMLKRNSGNNTIKTSENFTSFDDPDSDMISLTTSAAGGFRFSVGDEKRIDFNISDILQSKIYVVLTAVQASHMTIKLKTDNFLFVGNDYKYIDAITQINQGVYLGIQKEGTQSTYEGPSKITNAEVVAQPYTATRQLITDEHHPIDNYYQYEYDIECTKWNMALEYVATSAIGGTTYLPTVIIKQVSVKVDGITGTNDITVSNNNFKLDSAVAGHSTKTITNPTGVDDVAVTMTPKRWAIIKVNIQVAKKTLTYDSYTVWVKPKLIGADGTAYENLYDWDYTTNNNYCTGHFYIPDFYTQNMPRMFKLSFSPYYLNGSTESPLNISTETTLTSFEEFRFVLGTTEYTYQNTSFIIDTTKEDYSQIKDAICKQYDPTGGLFKDMSMYLTPKEGPPHLILRGVKIDNGQYAEGDVAVLYPVKSMLIYVYLYCPSLAQGLESGEFDGNASYNGSFTSYDTCIAETGTFMGKEYTHVLTFKNNETKDFFELNEQYPLNGVTSDRTYTFSITLDASTGTYNKEFVVRVSDVARNYLETSINSIVPAPGMEFWIDACAYIWKAVGDFNAVEKVEIDDSTDSKPLFNYYFNNYQQPVSAYFTVTPNGKRRTFTLNPGVDVDSLPDMLVL